MVALTGLAPARSFEHNLLRIARLLITPQGRIRWSREAPNNR